MRIGSISFRRLDSSLIDGLLKPEAYPHPADSIDMIETHISWVILTGPYAYKIKKPIRLGFLDFRELKRRLFYCEEEIRLNQPWAPEIYLDVVPISMQDGQPIVGGGGTAVEYAVRMRQFDQNQRLDVALAADNLSHDDMDQLAAIIARHHQAATIIRSDGSEEKLTRIKNDMWDNLHALEGVLATKKLRILRQWTGDQLDRLDTVLRKRIDDGFIRECHGDLHLSNLVRLPSGITAFDCIEFSDDLRNIDVMCDISFLVMDLVSRQRSDLAYRFINRYLELTGDYGSMQIFTLYFVYRCLVRAKVAAIRSQERDNRDAAKKDLTRMQKYCDMALEHSRDRTPSLIVMHGLSGSGKTWVSSRLLSAMPAIRILSDVERKRLFGLDETSDSESGVAKGIYTEAANREVYGLIRRLGKDILRAGHNVILDAAHLKESEREHAREIASECGAGFTIIHALGEEQLLRDRIRKRARRAGEVSEADLAVLDYQLGKAQPLSPAERRCTVRWDTGANTDIKYLLRSLTDPQRVSLP